MLVFELNCCDKGRKYVKWDLSSNEGEIHYRCFCAVFSERGKNIYEQLFFCPFCGKKIRVSEDGSSLVLADYVQSYEITTLDDISRLHFLVSPPPKGPTCPNCNIEMRLRKGAYGSFYSCSNYPKCTMAQSVDKQTGLLIGTPSDQETRQARIKAHKALDLLWKDSNFETQKTLRGRAYAWLSEKLKMPKVECHIRYFDIATCEKVINLCSNMTKDELLKDY